MKKSVVWGLSIILFFACHTNVDNFPWVYSSFTLQNKTTNTVKIQLYSNPEDTIIQLCPSDTCQFTYFLPGGAEPYRMPLSEYDSLDIIVEGNVNRYKSCDFTGPFNSGNYMPIDTVLVKEKRKNTISYLKFYLEYYITEE